ncbi:MAG: hypothetical protein NC098_00660 [Lachnoclostridium sp.]|nr:hypothetical protein [Lachnoclostridium sp.]
MGLSDRRKFLKIIGFQEFFFLPSPPNRRKILNQQVCKKGAVGLASKSAPSTGDISLFFNILQSSIFVLIAPSTLSKREQLNEVGGGEE